MAVSAPRATGSPEPTAGRVIASYGRHVLVESTPGSRHSCTLFGRRLDAVCGDEVRWLPAERDGPGVVVERLPRRTELARTDSRGRSEAMVANLTQLVVVSAGLPRPDFFVIDRYLAAAESNGIRAIVVLNKTDLAETREAMGELDGYAAIGYVALRCCAPTGAGIPDLRQALHGELSVLVGQSGVGKSSLANRLLPGLNARTAELSRATVEGRHVTSVATLHRLPEGGDIVDSPGVRDFAPALERLAQPALLFREFREPAATCRFGDCKHLREPDCGVQAALAAGAISARRYESYRRLARLQARFAESGATRRR
ncbi:MAG TPA: ribosome small subunit-dependent GTPase A [Steroidobacteraceae bacterium]|nr:ribosome small subunit-dependent GTPase A [Steroidobacteraceae bacterium]